jgi:hypothetical protein
MAQLKRLEMIVLRQYEAAMSADRESEPDTFEGIVESINSLLPGITLVRTDHGFGMASNAGEPLQHNAVSSGEAKLLSLAIEVLVFTRSANRYELLLLDEPDVHLHPDLQLKFIRFVEDTVGQDFKVAIATHSTALVGGFSEDADLQIAPVRSRDQVDFTCFKRDPVCQSILPIFGCHPLSSHFNETPVLLVEGDDDRRVFEQIVRSAGGRVKYSPCVVGTVSAMNTWEQWLSDYLPSIYDEPKGYSLRDGDGADQETLDNAGCVSRAKLSCYSMENLLLTDECLAAHGYTAQAFHERLSQWVENNPGHQYLTEVSDLCERYDERKRVSVKAVRNIVLERLGSNKPWEVVVGQLIANELDNSSADPHSVPSYLGADVVSKLFS